MNDDAFFQRIRKLMAEKHELKGRIRNCYSQLCENQGLCSSLQDARGLPRQDIDVREVMRIRKNIMHMEIEYDRLTQHIRKLSGELCSSLESEDDEPSMPSGHLNISNGSSIESFYSRITGSDAENENSCHSSSSPSVMPQTNEETKGEVIAVIVRVFPKSPARKAGLRPGDCILQFGPIDACNYDGNPVTFCQVAQQYENKTIPIKILREGKTLQKKIKPKHWCGCGLLGFLIDR